MADNECEVSKAFKARYGDSSSSGGADIRRLAQLEERTNENTKTIGKINITLDNLFSRLNESERTILEKLEKNQSNRQITAPLILSVMGVVISLALVAGMLINGSMEPLRLDIGNLKANVAEHHLLPGHVEALQVHAKQDAELEHMKWRMDNIESRQQTMHINYRDILIGNKNGGG